MRIKLKRGFQRKLILESKDKKDLTWKKLAEILNINKEYLRKDLAYERVLFSEKVYKKLCKISDDNYNRCIVARLHNNWGRIKGGKNSVKKEKLLIKNKSPELAELIGIILGDGNIWVKKGYYYVTIVGDSQKDRDYLLNYVNPLFRRLFGKEMYFYEHKTSKELFLSIGSKDVVFTLKHFGLQAGNKKKNNVGIPSWIFESEKYLRGCIRGLIDTDGSVCPITGRNYSYIWFFSSIENLRKTFSLAMKKLGFKTSKWIVQKNKASYIFIGSKPMIKKYIETINFKNKRHLNRLMPLSYSGQISLIKRD